LKRYLTLLLLPLLLAFISAHKFYVSITQVDYVEEKKSVQITSRIFTDDFERMLRKRYDKTITLGNNNIAYDAYIKKYLLSSIKVSVNGKPAILNFVGKEYEDDITYCYLEIENVRKIKSFEISNRVLFDLFKGQENIVRTKINSKNKSFILTTYEDTGVLNFD